MYKSKAAVVAIVDYGVGNIFSIKHTCEHVGLRTEITSSRQEILAADAVILPGVGAFGNAMHALQSLDLITVLQNVAISSKPILGICLGMQLLMTESSEFGQHAGLAVIPGTVVRFDSPHCPTGILKVPQVCWNRLHRVNKRGDGDPWTDTLLAGLPDETLMYFVHSYYVKPADASVVLATTWYGNIEYCSALRYRNIFACQGHPERSGPQGLQIYRNFAGLFN